MSLPLAQFNQCDLPAFPKEIWLLILRILQPFACSDGTKPRIPRRKLLLYLPSVSRAFRTLVYESVIILGVSIPLNHQHNWNVLTDRMLERFTTLRLLTPFQLGGRYYKPRWLSDVAVYGLSQLRVLDLTSDVGSGCDITNYGLAQLTNLTCLSITGNSHLNARGLSVLTNLVVLNMESNQVEEGLFAGLKMRLISIFGIQYINCEKVLGLR
jgi:hypothetical protein